VSRESCDRRRRRRFRYLNNLHHDSTTGTFLSVDPLVATTGEPYLYASGNPTSYSDPTGLEPGCGATASRASRGACAGAHRNADLLGTAAELRRSSDSLRAR
jgi:hypothetical protein